MIKKMKRQATEWEKIFVNDATDKGLISKTYKYLIQLNNNNNNNTLIFINKEIKTQSACDFPKVTQLFQTALRNT